MKKTKISIYSTDYFFEWLYRKLKRVVVTIIPSKLAALKIISVLTWFKDIN
ncbi:hypothetical protein [uncultured Psychroserpens sp.]|uniref:hypothetical protein n=1 Tax=uncultured Psychroserpens sp. TaxID=255436 RepID=UPI0026351279|nr:hypothetical protein [uncultured Psychroserpens sp.]